jgi:hypothetical protein
VKLVSIGFVRVQGLFVGSEVSAQFVYFLINKIITSQCYPQRLLRAVLSPKKGDKGSIIVHMLENHSYKVVKEDDQLLWDSNQYS